VQFKAKRGWRKPKACLDTMVSFRSPIQMTISLPLQNRKKAILAAGMAAKRSSHLFEQTHPKNWGAVGSRASNRGRREGKRVPES